MSSHDPLFFGIVLPLVVAINYAGYKSARSKLDEWSDRNCFKLLRATYVFIPMPWQPFWWRSRQGFIFLIHILDRDDYTRTGYAFCPAYSWFSDGSVQVQWD